MQVLPRVQKSAGHPYSTPADADLSNALQTYLSGTDYIVIEEADALQASLPAQVTSAVAPYIVPASGADSLYDTPSRAVPTIQQITGSEFTIPRSALGINVGAAWRTLDLSKVGWIRLSDTPFGWRNIEPTAGVYAPSVVAELDAVFAAAAAAGCQIVVPIDRPPASRSRTGVQHYLPGAPGSVGSPGAVSYTALTDLVSWFLGRYGNLVTAFETWNEPSVSSSYLDSTGISGVIAFHNSVATTVATWNSGNSGTVKVIGLTNTGWDGLTSTARSVDLLQASGGFANCDAFGYHIYRGGGATPFDVPINLMRPLLTAKAATAASAKELWITEFGDSMMSKVGNTEAFWLRIYLYWLGLGAHRIAPYAWDQLGIGDMRVSPVSSAFYAAMDRLRGASVGYVNAIHGGKQIAARINGQDLII